MPPPRPCLEGIREFASAAAAERAERQGRRHLDPADFERLRLTGFPEMIIPRRVGGTLDDLRRSVRPIAGALRALAAGDPSVALVAAMHPAVLSYWAVLPEVADGAERTWSAQVDEVFATVRAGAWWGTITSEPGSGGDIMKTRARARPDNGGAAWKLTGQKHFGSGSGITSTMVTTAVPEGEGTPDLFFLDFRGASSGGSTGMRLVQPWDGHGMTATQSHAFAFEDFPAARLAWPGHLPDILDATGGFIGCLFAAVFVGIIETAIAEARARLEPRRAELRALEEVEWIRAETEAWTVHQAFDGMLRAVESTGSTPRDVLHGKAVIADLAESCLARLCRVIGGGAYARHSPFGFWFEDVRALSFLRPPFPLLFERLGTSMAGGGDTQE